MPVELVARLQTFSHTESLRTGTEIRWSSLVRVAVEEYLARVERGKKELAQNVACEAERAEALPAHSALANAEPGGEFLVDDEAVHGVQF